MSPKTWFYRDGRPNRVARVIDRCTAALAARGVGPDYLVTLDVPGRRSGRTIAVPLVVADADGERYVVSMLGEDTNWVRNVRAAGRRCHPPSRSARARASGGGAAGAAGDRAQGVPAAGAQREGPRARRPGRAAG